MPVELDISLFHAPCATVSLQYLDIMGQNRDNIPVAKYQIDSVGKVDTKEFSFTAKEDKDMEILAETSTKYPGCRIKGQVDSVYKAKGEIHVNFLSEYSTYKYLSVQKGIKIDLAFKVNSFTFGHPAAQLKVIRDLEPFDGKIKAKMTPFTTDPVHNEKGFRAMYNLQIFPIEFKSDFHTHDSHPDKDDSYMYTFVEHIKKIDEDMDNTELVFQLEFKPIIRVYHLKMRSMKIWLLTLLGVCGGVLGIAGVINKLF